jgi:cold shock CspA family protein
VQEQLRRASSVANPHRGGKYIVVYAPAFEHFAVWGLAEGHRVPVDVAEGRKGPEALSIRLI